MPKSDGRPYFNPYLMENDFERLESYLKHIPRSLKLAEADLDRKAKRDLARLERRAKRSEFDVEFWGSKHVEIVNDFPPIAWSSAFLTVFSWFEHFMVLMCEHLGHGRVSFNRFKEKCEEQDEEISYVDVCRLFLEKHFEYAIDPESPEWSEMTTLRRIRNQIVHDRGRLKAGQTKLREYVKQHGVMLLHRDRVALNQAFCEHALDVFRDLLRTISKAKFPQLSAEEMLAMLRRVAERNREEESPGD